MGLQDILVLIIINNKATSWRVIELSLSFIAVADFIYDTYWGWFSTFLSAN